MAGTWRISQWPECEFHVFLSHSAEDRDDLIFPIKRALEAGGVVAWLDCHHYPIAAGSHEALREALLRCRHLVYFVTSETLRQARGWIHAERTYGELIQAHGRFFDKELFRYELPLFFVKNDHKTLLRSTWHSLMADKGRFFRAKRGSTKSDQINWAVEQITSFIKKEQRRAVDIAHHVQHDPELFRRFSKEQHLMRRIAAADPPELAPRMR